LRAIWADKLGIPIVLSPPAVSALKTIVARYLFGSRALMPDSDSGEALAFAFAGVLFVFAVRLAFEFVFVSVAGRQLLATVTNAMRHAK
jgi:hypothetical protein